MARFIIFITMLAAAVAVCRDCMAALEPRGPRQPAVLTPSYSLTPTVGVFVFDGHSKLESSPMYGMRLGFDTMGKNAVDSLGVELGLDFANTRFKDGKGTANVYLMRAEAFYSLLPRARFVPSFVAGIGGIGTSGAGATQLSGFFDYGASAKYFLTDYMAIRGDLRHVLVYQDVAARSNYEATIGLLLYAKYDDKLKRVPPVDTDQDGVPDYLDKCPATPRGVRIDRDGCPLDADGDGIPDYLEKCPLTPKGVKADMQGCPVDSDGNGVPDYINKCPGTPQGVKVGRDGCPDKGSAGESFPAQGGEEPSRGGAPPPAADKKADKPVQAPVKNPVQAPAVDAGPKPRGVTLLDSDGDGVPDYLDKCPDTPKGAVVGPDGCPVQATDPKPLTSGPPASPIPGEPVVPQPAPVAAARVVMMPDRCQQPQPGRSQIQKKKALKSLMLSFKTAQTGISRNDQDRVARMARYLRNHPETVALVEGYADSVGPFDYNLTLSRVRTLSVRNHLMQQGEIDGGRISVAVYGCKPPAAGTGGGKKRPESGSGVILITLTRGAPASP